MALRHMTCCGAREYSGLQKTPEESLYIMCNYEIVVGGNNYGGIFKCAYIVFTDNNNHTRGIELARFIRKRHLGTLINTGQRKNPNSGNLVKLWIWAPNEDAVNKWYNKYHKKVEEERRISKKKAEIAMAEMIKLKSQQ